MERIYPAVWLALPKETREHLAKVFGISASGITEVRDQSVVSDGFTVEDLGTHSEASVDYPDFAHPVAQWVEDGKAS